MTVTDYEVHTIDSAPAAARPALEQLVTAVGMIPNLAGVMAGSPTLIDSFVAARRIWQGGSFTPAERELVALVNAVENGCGYCQAIHSAFGLRAGLTADVVQAVRDQRPTGVPTYDALAAYARGVLHGRGRVDDTVVRAFYEAGYAKAQSLEVIAGLAVSVLANYTSHLTHPPLDAALQAHQ